MILRETMQPGAVGGTKMTTASAYIDWLMRNSGVRSGQSPGQAGYNGNMTAFPDDYTGTPQENPDAGMFLDTSDQNDQTPGSPTANSSLSPFEQINGVGAGNRRPNVSDPGYRPNNAGMGYDPMAGNSFGSGNVNGSVNQNAGSRRLAGSSVNYGNVAGIQNYLENQMRLGPQAYQAAVQSLLQQGIMPSVNGVPLDQIISGGGGSGAQFAQGISGGQPQSKGAYGGAGERTGSYDAPAYGGGGQQSMFTNPAAAGHTGPIFGNQTSSPTAFPTTLRVNAGGLLGGGKNLFQGTTNPTGSPAGANNQRSEQGPLGLPLEGRSQGAILNMFDNPTGLTEQQTNQARNRSSSAIDQQGAEQRRSIQEDAVRRGVAPSEVSGSLAASGQAQTAARTSAQNNFDFQNAQAGNQGRLAAVGAAGGIMNGQIGNEDSIRRYLAMLGANSAGNKPSYLVS